MENKYFELVGILEREVRKLEYGTITMNVFVNNGLPVINTLDLVRWKRKKYKVSSYENEKQS